MTGKRGHWDYSPEAMAKRKARNRSPESLARIRAYMATPKAKAHRNTPEFRARLRELNKWWAARRKLTALIAYGGDPPKCACCGESNMGFLTIDHINDDGHLDGRGSRTSLLYSYLQRNNYPPLPLQVLCANCNCGRAWNGGICPHKENPIANG